MFSIETRGLFRKRHRVLADSTLGAKEFQEILRSLGTAPIKARKTGFVAARLAARREPVATRWNGEESSDTAEPGDWIVTNLDPNRGMLRDSAAHANTYVIRAERFHELYEPADGANEFGAIYRAKERVEALYLSGGFAILAPWGEMQRASEGYLLHNGAEVYGNNKETFEATYEVE
jgi:hypothetical protein